MVLRVPLARRMYSVMRVCDSCRYAQTLLHHPRDVCSGVLCCVVLFVGFVCIVWLWDALVLLFFLFAPCLWMFCALWLLLLAVVHVSLFC